MFEKKISEKSARLLTPDERQEINALLDEHDFYNNEYIKVSHLKLDWFWVRDNLKLDQSTATPPLCITKSWNSTYSFTDFERPPLYLMGVFFSAVRGDQVDLNRNPDLTFTELKTVIGQQNDVLEGGLNPIRPTQTWMRKPVSGYFVTGKTILEMSDDDKKVLLSSPALNA